MSDADGMAAAKCECVPDGDGYACQCPCGVRMRSDVRHVFHACSATPESVSAALALAAGPPPDAAQSGPGTELKSLLKWVGITSSPTCSCNAHARQMDLWGPDECEKRQDEIVGWLEEEAKKRRLPFIRLAGEQLVRLAIRRARKAAAK